MSVDGMSLDPSRQSRRFCLGSVQGSTLPRHSQGHGKLPPLSPPPKSVFGMKRASFGAGGVGNVGSFVNPISTTGPKAHAYLLFGFTLARANARMLINAEAKRRSARNSVRASRPQSTSSVAVFG